MADKYAQALLWIDIETPGLPPAAVDETIDYRDLPVLEFAALITDFDLKPVAGYHEAIQLTQRGASMLRANDFVREMHRESGLTEACIKSTFSLHDVEDVVLNMLKTQTSLTEGEFMIAGSGVATFDFPLIKAKMPRLARWLAYYPFDIGVLRRVSHTLTGGVDIVDHPQSYRAGVKRHRAWDDVEAHLEEARRWGTVFQKVAQAGVRG
jgi:oligoribonuclease